MRARRLCGLTLAVALAHAIGWRLAVGAPPARPPVRAVVHWIEPARTEAAASVSPAHAQAPVPPAPRARGAVARAHANAGAARPLPAPVPADPDAAQWPTYPTRPPPPLALRYALTPASGAAGDAEIDWANDGRGFTLRVATAPAGRAAREWVSAGGFDAAGLAPVRLSEREKGRDKRAVNFDQAARQVRFSAAPQALAIAPGAQDRWSWVAQLAAIAEAAGAPVAPGTTWQLQVAGLRGELDRWTFRVLGDAPPPGNEVSAGCARACPLLHVLREPERPYDLRVEAWLAPGLHHFPAALQLSTPPGGWSLSLQALEGGP
jgi:hypothetical protein